jgi:hypothetical protein
MQRFNSVRLRKVLSALMLFALISLSWAAFTCAGNVYLNLTDVGVALNWLIVCNVNASYNAVEPQACKAIYAMLTTARALDKKVIFWFDFSGTTAGPCDSSRFPAWTVMSTTGASAWYLGPAYAN